MRREDKVGSTSGTGRKKTRLRAKNSKGEDLAQRSEDSRSIVNSLSKGLRVLESFSAERPEMTLSQIAAAAQIDPGTAFRMLNTLVMLGYVARNAETRRFRLTLKAIDLGLHAIGHADLRELARPILRSLVGEVSEAASLGVLDGSDILYIERVRAGLTRLGVDIRIGTTIPAACSVIGHAMLAYLTPRDLNHVLETAPRLGGSLSPQLTREEIDRGLAKVRRQGYALADSYLGSGLRILAVPVLDVDRHPVAAVSVAAPALSLSAEEFRVHALGLVRAAAADIARVVQASGTISVIA